VQFSTEDGRFTERRQVRLNVEMPFVEAQERELS